MAALIARQSMAKDLPPFSGDPLEWPTWKAQFAQSSSTCRMTSSENLIRLQRALKGKAREAVGPLLMDPTQVQEILAVLEQRYGGTNSLASLMLDKARKLPHLTAEASLEDLADFSGTVQNLVASLRSLSNDGYLTNPALLSDIAGKMPCTMRLAWLMEVRHYEASATICQFAAFLKTVANAIPKSGMIDSARSRPRREQTYATTDQLGSQQRNGANEKLASNDKWVPKDKYKKGAKGDETKIRHNETGNPDGCVQCGDTEHLLRECQAFAAKNVKLRWESVKSAGLCRICLEKHSSRTCKYRNWCGIGECRASHHKLLHDPTYVRRSAVAGIVNNM